MGLYIPDEGIIHMDRIREINLVGDPGCDGLGAGIMTTFAKALDSPGADLTLIIGDMVPYGSKKIYSNISEFINSYDSGPVYCLKGNHDTRYYDEFFGSPNYAISSPELLLIVLDNAARRFTPEALSFCRKALEEAADKADNIVLAFHYPPPNPIATNSVNPPQWKELQEIYAPFRDKLRYFIAGHVHTLVETECEGYPVLVSGGGGARIEALNPERKDSERHHRIRLYLNDRGTLSHEVVFLDELRYERELEDDTTRGNLEESLNGEIKAHFKYGMMAFKAKQEGRPALAELFNTLAESEFYHALNHYEVLGLSAPFAKEIEKAIRDEAHEIETMYPAYSAYAKERGQSLARYTFEDAMNAEAVHKGMLERAREELKEKQDISEKSYYVCSSCGYTFELEPQTDPPRRCPVCGAPQDKILESHKEKI